MTLHLAHVTLTYPDGERRLTALDRVSLVAEPGTLTAVVGPSGSGKSSLLAVAATLITPDSGRVLLDGDDLAALNRKQTARVRREKIGIVFQSSNLLASLTTVDQLLVIAHLAGKPLGVSHIDLLPGATRAAIGFLGTSGAAGSEIFSIDSRGRPTWLISLRDPQRRSGRADHRLVDPVFDRARHPVL